MTVVHDTGNLKKILLPTATLTKKCDTLVEKLCYFLTERVIVNIYHGSL